MAKPPVAVLDELHKYSKWKSLLKGFFDTYGDRVHLIVTGSSRLDVFRRGSDSLMGRYLLYRMHPWSVGESLRTDLPPREIQPPRLERLGYFVTLTPQETAAAVSQYQTVESHP